MPGKSDNFAALAARIGLGADAADDVQTVAELAGKSPEEMTGLLLMMVLRGQGLFRSDVDDEKRRTAAARLGILERWNAARRDGNRKGRSIVQISQAFLAELAAEGTSITLTTLYNWDKRWRAGGLEGLIDRRAGADSSSDDPFLNEVARHYRGDSRLKLTQCVALAAATAKAKGWTVRSYHAAQRFLKRRSKAVQNGSRGCPLGASVLQTRSSAKAG